MHREILGFPAGEVDHINHNGLDNRRENLRIVDKSGNGLNKKRVTVGVTYHKNTKVWVAQCMRNKKRIYLGCSKTRVGARKMYLEFIKTEKHGK